MVLPSPFAERSGSEIEPTRVHEALEQHLPFRLIDCREEDEFRICRIEAGELIPLSHFSQLVPGRLTELNECIVVYCHHGMRSLKAARFLAAQGFRHVYSMRGGIDAWSREVDPGVPMY